MPSFGYLASAKQKKDKMNPEKKKKILRIATIVLLFLNAIAVIATCAAVWNSKQGAFPSICAIVVFAVNAWGIYRNARNLKWTDGE